MLNPINRTSLSTNLEQRYQAAPRLGGDIGTAKFVGTTRAATDFIDGTAWQLRGTARDVHSVNFSLNGRVPGFTPAAFSFASDVLKHSNQKYYG